MSEPIAAIATPPVPSAIGIVRVSGEGAIEAASAVFRAASGRPLAACESRRLVYGTLLGPDGAPIDQVLATLSRAPHSYTGEDTAELQCHGSPAVLAMALEALFAQGVRQAGPGEFTKRAFLNGKLDLTQAEAVADLLAGRLAYDPDTVCSHHHEGDGAHQCGGHGEGEGHSCGHSHGAGGQGCAGHQG